MLGEQEATAEETAEAAEEKEGENQAHEAPLSPTKPLLHRQGEGGGGERNTEPPPTKRRRSRRRKRRRKEQKAATREHLGQLAPGDRRRPRPDLLRHTQEAAERAWLTC